LLIAKSRGKKKSKTTAGTEITQTREAGFPNDSQRKEGGRGYTALVDGLVTL
jgi:hypothetical protein